VAPNWQAAISLKGQSGDGSSLEISRSMFDEEIQSFPTTSINLAMVPTEAQWAIADSTAKLRCRAGPLPMRWNRSMLNGIARGSVSMIRKSVISTTAVRPNCVMNPTMDMPPSQ
jgi:hypothetical protein